MKNEKQKMKEEERKLRKLHMCKRGNMVVFTTPERDRYATSIAMVRMFSTDQKKHFLYVNTEVDNLKRINEVMKKTRGNFGDKTKKSK